MDVEGGQGSEDRDLRGGLLQGTFPREFSDALSHVLRPDQWSGTFTSETSSVEGSVTPRVWTRPRTCVWGVRTVDREGGWEV